MWEKQLGKMGKYGQGVMTHTQSSSLCMAKHLAFVVAV
jgi:hypothetical protein